VRKLLPLLLLGSFASSSAQRPSDTAAQPQASFKAGTKLVEVDVVVHDKHGPVAGLTKGYFTLLDNGQEQDIAFFSVRSASGPVPVQPRAAVAPLPPGAVSNRPGPTEDAPATETVLLLDRLFTQPADQIYAIQRIQRFLDRRRARDGVGIYTLATRLEVLQDVTDSDALLRRALNRLQGGKAYSRDTDTNGMSGHTASEFLSLQTRMPVDSLKQAFEAIARHVANVPGRKALVWITDGFALKSETDDFRPDVEEAARALNDANVVLFAVDARGLIGALGPMTGIPNAESRGPSLQQLNQATRMRAAAPIGPTHVDTMNLLATSTGGAAFYNTNGLEDSFQQAVEDGDITYSLGFYPSDASQDGTLHKLIVKVARARVSVRYRQTYLAAKPQPEAQNHPRLDQLLRDPLNATQIGLIAQAPPDPSHPGVFNAQLSVDLHDIQLENQNGKLAGAVNISFYVENANSAQELTRNIEIPQDQLAAALAQGIVIRHAIELPARQAPAKVVDLRIVVQDKASGAVGSLRIPLASK
jgi:VWFA-related protein